MLLHPWIFVMVMILTEKIICTYFYYSSTLQCINQSQQHCKKWNQTFFIARGGFLFSEPIFGNQTVYTPQGLKLISQIREGDKLLSYNIQTGQNQFNTMSTWLHIDQEAHMDFIQIKTKEGDIYILSNKTNIAIKTNENEILYKFVQNLQQGEVLQIYGKTATVQKIGTNIQKQGMYLPYVQGGNFYIFPQNSKNQSSMILIHCFGNLQNPEIYHTWIRPFIKILNYFEFDIQKVQFYEHPIGNLMAYLNAQPSRNTRIYRGSHSSSHSSSSHSSSSHSSSSHSSSSHSYTPHSTSLNNNRQVQRRKKQLVAVLAMKQISNIVLLNN